jgi:hypothetical protein
MPDTCTPIYTQKVSPFTVKNSPYSPICYQPLNFLLMDGTEFFLMDGTNLDFME